MPYVAIKAYPKDEDTKKKAHTDGGLLTAQADSVTLIAGSFEFDE